MKKLSLEDLGRVDIPTFKALDKRPVAVLLDNIRSGHNVGAVFRSADAFLIEKIILTGITPVPPHREISKSAIGATNSVEWNYERDVLKAVLLYKEAGYRIIGVEQTDQSIPLQEFPITGEVPSLLIFGNEVGGITQSILPLLDIAIEIPQYGTKHSLNISVCAGIVLWHFTR